MGKGLKLKRVRQGQLGRVERPINVQDTIIGRKAKKALATERKCGDEKIEESANLGFRRIWEAALPLAARASSLPLSLQSSADYANSNDSKRDGNRQEQQ